MLYPVVSKSDSPCDGRVQAPHSSMAKGEGARADLIQDLHDDGTFQEVDCDKGDTAHEDGLGGVGKRSLEERHQWLISIIWSGLCLVRNGNLPF